MLNIVMPAQDKPDGHEDNGLQKETAMPEINRSKPTGLCGTVLLLGMHIAAVCPGICKERIFCFPGFVLFINLLGLVLSDLYVGNRCHVLYSSANRVAAHRE
ncbi:MAG: hypothetical protein ACLFQY_01350 [Desulfococcaceae bacterium]